MMTNPKPEFVWKPRPKCCCNANPNVQRNRRQAAQVFPWLADRFAQISGQHEIYRLQQNLDNGNPLIPVIAGHFGADLRAVRFLVGKSFDLVGGEWRGDPEGLLEMAALLKPERRPKTEEVDNESPADESQGWPTMNNCCATLPSPDIS